MNLLDWIFFVIIGASTVYGLFKGLIREIISILAVIFGLMGGSRFYGKLAFLFKNLGLNEQPANIVSFFILFIIILIMVILLGKLLHKFVHSFFLGWINRIGGIGFGFLRGIILTSIIIIFLTITLSEKAPILAQSKLLPHIMKISKILILLVPEDLHKHFSEQERKLREFWGKNLDSQEKRRRGGFEKC